MYVQMQKLAVNHPPPGCMTTYIGQYLLYICVLKDMYIYSYHAADITLTFQITRSTRRTIVCSAHIITLRTRLLFVLLHVTNTNSDLCSLARRYISACTRRQIFIQLAARPTWMPKLARSMWVNPRGAHDPQYSFGKRSYDRDTSQGY